jgi:hypothetical protein
MITHGRSLEDVKVQRSLGGLPYTNNISITGYIESLTANWQIVSPNANVAALPHGMPSEAEFVSIASTSANDTVAGTGARVVIVTGVDEFYNEHQELILMNGQTPVQTVVKMIPFELIVLQFGSNVNADGDSTPVGTIYCGNGVFTAGVPAVPMVAIEPSSADPNSRDAIFVVPDGKLLLWKSLFVTADPDKTENISAIVQLAVKLYGLGENQWFKTLPYHFDGVYNAVPENIVPFPPRTQIQFRCKTSGIKTKAVSIQADFELKELR